MSKKQTAASKVGQESISTYLERAEKARKAIDEKPVSEQAEARDQLRQKIGATTASQLLSALEWFEKDKTDPDYPAIVKKFDDRGVPATSIRTLSPHLPGPKRAIAFLEECTGAKEGKITLRMVTEFVDGHFESSNPNAGRRPRDRKQNPAAYYADLERLSRNWVKRFEIDLQKPMPVVPENLVPRVRAALERLVNLATVLRDGLPQTKPKQPRGRAGA